jgi:hypothetical protein
MELFFSLHGDSKENNLLVVDCDVAGLRLGSCEASPCWASIGDFFSFTVSASSSFLGDVSLASFLGG